MANDAKHLRMTDGTVVDLYTNSTIIIDANFNPPRNTTMSFTINSVHRYGETTSLSNDVILSDFRNGIDVIVKIGDNYMKCVSSVKAPGAPNGLQFKMYYPWGFIAQVWFYPGYNTPVISSTNFLDGYAVLTVTSNSITGVVDGSPVHYSDYTRIVNGDSKPDLLIDLPELTGYYNAVAKPGATTQTANNLYIFADEYKVTNSVLTITKHLYIVNRYNQANPTFEHYTKVLT